MTDETPPSAASTATTRRAASLASQPGPVRHGKQKHGSSVASLFKLLGIGLAVALVSVGTVGGYTAWSLANRILDNSVDISQPGDTPPPQIGAFDGGFNIMVVGVDNDSEQGDAYGERGATLNDVNILLHVSADHTNATAVSLPRDLLIDQPECTNPDTGAVSSAAYNRSINQTMQRGGLGCVVNTVEELTGLEISYAAQMTFASVVEMTNAVGGVDVCVANDINDDYSGLHLEAGVHNISGNTALQFLRTRHGVGDQSDLARIATQQVYMSSLVRELKSTDTLTNVGKLYSLASIAADSVKLSTSLASVDTMVAMAQTLRTINLDEMAFVQYPTITSPSDRNKVEPNQSVADELFERLANDEAVKPDGEALNGSVVVTEPTDTPTTPATPTQAPTPTGTPSGEPTVAPTPTTPPTAIANLGGTTANQETCTVGNG